MNKNRLNRDVFRHTCSNYLRFFILQTPSVGAAWLNALLFKRMDGDFITYNSFS